MRLRLSAVAAAAVLSACSGSDSSRLHAQYPKAAGRILSGPGFAADGGGFVRAERPDPALADPVKAAEASLARRGGLHVKLPGDGADAATFTLPGGTAVAVRERSLAGAARLEGGAIVYSRADGASYWSASGDGFEEWVEVSDAGPGPVAEWDVGGATLRQAGDAVELLDARGVARARVTAPIAYEAGGVEKRAWLRAEGGRIALFTDARGPAIVDPAWTTAGSMATARANHTATLLSSGKVLVAGGMTAASGATTATAELFDPATGSWSATGSMATARYGHTAVLLKNGKVLMTAGFTGSTYTQTVELYDPSAGTFATTGATSTKHYAATATLLPSGKVLVASGNTYDYTQTTVAELYDPSAGTWAPTGSLTTGRAWAASTLLPSGKVLVAGGGTVANAYTATAELYDPVAGTWASTGSLATARWFHGATLLTSGQVIVTGGAGTAGTLATAELYDPTAGTWSAATGMAAARAGHAASLLPSGKLLIAGGGGASGPIGGVELYDPSTNTWSSALSLGTVRSSATATVLPSGRVLVVGGATDASGTPTQTAEQYEPATGGWSATNPLSTARTYCSATLLPNRKVLVAGGWAGGTVYANAELFDPAAGTWSPTGSLAVARHSHTASLLPNGKVLVSGGWAGGSIYPVSAELYDPVAGTWSTTGSLAAGRYSHTATLLPNGKVLVVGGQTSSAIASAELYDPAAGTWSNTGSLTAARTLHTATLLPNGKVLAAGAFNPSVLGSAELYNPATGTWSATGSLVAARGVHAATLLPNGKVLVSGGQGPAFLASAELYDPATGTWASTGSLAVARSFQASVLLQNGKVLVAGGQNPTPLSSAELYEPLAGTWSAATSLSAARYDPRSTLLADGRWLVVGGYDGAVVTSVELFSEGRGAQAGWTPSITSVPSSVAVGSAAPLVGTLFTGISPGNSGSTNGSPAGYPLAALRTANEGVRAWLPLTDYSASTATATVPATFPPGPAWLSVVVNGIPSAEQYVLVTATNALATMPGSATVPPRGTQQFTASGGTGAGYVWSIQTAGSGGATITAGGLYTAGPSGSASDVVKLTDSSAASTTVTVTVGPGVTLSPTTATVAAGASRIFTVSGGSGTYTTWTVSPNGSGGNIAAGGVYTAGATAPASDSVVVTDSLGNSASATISVTVAPPALVITPGSANIPPKGTQQFTASGGTGTGYVWSIQTDGSGGATITSGGLLTAGPNGVADVVVKVSDSAAVSTTVTVTVGPGVSISPTTASVTAGGSRAFSASGGNGSYTWTLSPNNSGGSVTAGGVYTAGATAPSTDTVVATDGLGNSSSATVSVTVAGGTPPAPTTPTAEKPAQENPLSCGHTAGAPALVALLPLLLLRRVRRRASVGPSRALLVALLAGALPFAASAIVPKTKPKVAVLRLSAGGGIDANTADVVTDALVTSMQEWLNQPVITNRDVEAAIGFEKQKQMVGCTQDAACMAEIGGALGVERIVTGSIAKLEGTLIFSAQVMDVRTAVVERRYQARLRSASLDALLEAADTAVAKLFPQKALGPGVASAPPPAATPPAPPPAREAAASPPTPAAVASVLPAPAAPRASEEEPAAAPTTPGGVRVRALLNAQLDDPGGTAGLALGYRKGAFEVAVSGLFTGGKNPGADLELRWYAPKVGSAGPYLGVAATGVFAEGTYVGATAVAGVEFGSGRLRWNVQVPFTYVVSKPANAKPWWLQAGAGVSWGL
jgi:N-acetylneuraminic acid mutarotase/TolB-like protein